jgi:hypothetical protein
VKVYASAFLISIIIFLSFVLVVIELATYVVHVTGFIQTLINKKQYIDAINFIYAFELVKEFQPVPPLKYYLHDSKIAAKIIRRSDKSVEALV